MKYRYKSLGQLFLRIPNYFNTWVELSEVGKTFEDVKALMVREIYQFVSEDV